MRSYTQILASSVVFTSASGLISSSAYATTGQFSTNRTPPWDITYCDGAAIQCNFGGGSSPSGTFNVIAGNTPEYRNMAVATSALISSTGSVTVNLWGIESRYVDFQFIPAGNSSSAFLTVVLTAKGKA